MNFQLGPIHQKYPVGTSVTARPVTAWGGNGFVDESASPAGSATDTQTMTASGLIFTGLAPRTKYVAHAEVDSTDVYTYFTTGSSDLPADSGYVDPEGAGTGESWADPSATLQAAIDAAGVGDTIYVKPGTYDENIVITTDYLTLVGVNGGYGRPDIVPASGLALDGTAQGVVLKSLRFASDGQDSDVARWEGNGFRFEDCVFDGDAGMGAATALLRLWCNDADDSYTASEGKITDCLFRGSGGLGVVFDIQDAAVGVGPTHGVLSDSRFQAIDGEDIIAAETAAGTYSIQDYLFERNKHLDRNKATYIDLDAVNGATNTGCMFAGCYFHDDTIDTTAIKVATADAGVVGCYGLDGLIDGDALD